MKTTRTKVLAVECSKCGDIIYSRDRHDYHRCSCGEISIDGGFDYARIGYVSEMPKRMHKFVNATKDQLWADWNNRKDKFGVIKKLTPKKKTSRVKTVKG